MLRQDLPTALVRGSKGTILFISSEFPPGPGGIGTNAHQVASQLTKRNWKVTVISPQDYVTSYEADAFNECQPFRIVRMPSVRPYMLKWVVRLVLALSVAIRQRPDLILGSSYAPTLLGATIAWMLGLRYVVVTHGHELLMPPRIMARALRRAFVRSEGIVAVSNFAKDNATRHGVRSESITVINNGADADKFRQTDAGTAIRQGLKLSGKHVLLTVGNVCRRKAQDIVIRAMPMIMQRFPDLIYLVVGAPTMRKEYEQLARELGVDDRVIFAGIIPDNELVAYYCACDIFVMVSRRVDQWDCEGFGIVALEASLCGKPVVATRNCGLAEAVVDGETGLLVEMDDPHETAHAIIRLLADDELRLKLGRQGRKRALEECTWEKRGEQYNRLLLTILNGRRK